MVEVGGGGGGGGGGVTALSWGGSWHLRGEEGVGELKQSIAGRKKEDKIEKERWKETLCWVDYVYWCDRN